jgi:hypothetical protein
MTLEKFFLKKRHFLLCFLVLRREKTYDERENVPKGSTERMYNVQCPRLVAALWFSLWSSSWLSRSSLPFPLLAETGSTELQETKVTLGTSH